MAVRGLGRVPAGHAQRTPLARCAQTTMLSRYWPVAGPNGPPEVTGAGTCSTGISMRTGVARASGWAVGVVAGCGAAVPQPEGGSTPRQASHPAPGDVPLQGMTAPD